MIVKPYPKDNEARMFGVREQWLDAIAKHISSRGLSRDELLFATEAGTPISAILSERACGFQPLRPRVSILTSVCTTFATLMRLGCSPAALI